MPRAKQPNPANQRTDLLTPSAPGRAMEAPDQSYGRQTAQAQSQRILPIGPQATPAAPAPATQAAPAAPGGALPPGAVSGASAPGGPHAGNAPWVEPGSLMQPTIDPRHEAMAAGIAQQSQAMAQTGEQGTLQSVLSHLASQPGASSITRSLAATAGR